MTGTAFDLLIAPWTTEIVFAAVRLKLFTILSDREMTVEEIASYSGAVARLLEALLNACVSMGLLVSQGGKYANSDFSKVHLVEGGPRYVGDLITVQDEERRQWHRLSEIIKGSDPAIDEQEPKAPVDRRTFTRAMDNLGMLGEAEALRDAVDLSGRRAMVDVGAGSGLYSVVLCGAYPELRATLLDRKETLVVTEEMISGRPEKDRITLREADITKDPFGEEVDVVLLSDVVYDEAEAIPVLRSAWDCLRTDGLLVVRGYYSDPERSKPLFGAVFALNVLVFDPGRRLLTVDALQRHVAEAGFRITRVSPLTERSTLLIATK